MPSSKASPIPARRIVATCCRAGVARETRRQRRPRTSGPPTSEQEELEVRLHEAEAHAEEYADQLRRAREDLAGADERARELAAELATRDAEHEERVQALASERDDVEGRLTSLTEAAATAARERGDLEQAPR